MKRLPRPLKENLRTVFFLSPNSLGGGFLDNYYKRVTARLKSFPWILIPLAILMTVILFIFGGRRVIFLVNYLCSLE